MNDNFPDPPALATSPRAMPKAVKVVDVAKKAKTAKKLAAAEKLKALEASIDAAYAVDPSDALAPFLAKLFARGDVRVAVTPAAPADLTAEEKKWMWSLLEANMKPVYEASKTWATEARDKRREMGEDETRYLIARDASGENADPNAASPAASSSSSARSPPLGFVHYRFVVEEDVAVLYVYELQFDAAARGRGLGRFLMMLCEALAKRAGVDGVMLTVQKANEGAMKFYAKAKYDVSIVSPSKVDPWASDEYDYEIMAKLFRRVRVPPGGRFSPPARPSVSIPTPHRDASIDDSI